MKKFLRKIPGGIFGPQNEATIFNIIKMTDTGEQLKAVHRLMTSLPTYSQHLLVLLFGTFRVIAANSVVNETNMTAQALGVRYVYIEKASVLLIIFVQCCSLIFPHLCRGGKQGRGQDGGRGEVQGEFWGRDNSFQILDRCPGP